MTKLNLLNADTLHRILNGGATETEVRTIVRAVHTQAELLDALKRLMRDAAIDGMPENASALIIARAAIAKAEGA